MERSDRLTDVLAMILEEATGGIPPDPRETEEVARDILENVRGVRGRNGSESREELARLVADRLKHTGIRRDRRSRAGQLILSLLERSFEPGSFAHLSLGLLQHGGGPGRQMLRYMIRRLLEDPDLPLHSGLLERLAADRVLGSMLSAIMQEEDGGMELVGMSGMWLTEISGLRVACNPTPDDLVGEADREGADLYVASSGGRGVILALHGGRFPPDRVLEVAMRAGGHWTIPRPGVAVSPANAPPVERILEAIRSVMTNEQTARAGPEAAGRRSRRR